MLLFHGTHLGSGLHLTWVRPMHGTACAAYVGALTERSMYTCECNKSVVRASDCACSCGVRHPASSVSLMKVLWLHDTRTASTQAGYCCNLACYMARKWVNAFSSSV